ncbi:MAG: TerB family tellurite resistance protein [Proteobacteria bacterium]|nr:TerB family tellurite resistance protein [Pseudomonadota bacterium]
MGFFKTVACIMFPGPTLAVYAGSKAKDYISNKIEKRDNKIRDEGRKTAEAAAAKKYEQKVTQLTERLKGYHDFDKTVLALYAIGLATANADGHISKDELDEIDAFVSGWASEILPQHIREAINELREAPPTLAHAVAFAREANLKKADVQDVMDIVSLADGTICEYEKKFIAQWEQMAKELELA